MAGKAPPSARPAPPAPRSRTAVWRRSSSAGCTNSSRTSSPPTTGWAPLLPSSTWSEAVGLARFAKPADWDADAISDDADRALPCYPSTAGTGQLRSHPHAAPYLASDDLSLRHAGNRRDPDPAGHAAQSRRPVSHQLAYRRLDRLPPRSAQGRLRQYHAYVHGRWPAR